MPIRPASIREAAFDPARSRGVRLPLPALRIFGWLPGSSRIGREWHESDYSVRSIGWRCCLRLRFGFRTPHSAIQGVPDIHVRVKPDTRVESSYPRRQIIDSKKREHEACLVRFRLSLPWRNSVRRRQYAGATLASVEPREFGITVVDSS